MVLPKLYTWVDRGKVEYSFMCKERRWCMQRPHGAQAQAGKNIRICMGIYI